MTAIADPRAAFLEWGGARPIHCRAGSIATLASARVSSRTRAQRHRPVPTAVSRGVTMVGSSADRGFASPTARVGRLERLAHFTTRYRWPVIGVWIVLTLFGGYAAGQLSSRWYQSL